MAKPQDSGGLPEEALDAAFKQREWRDEHTKANWSPLEALELDLLAAAPAIRAQERDRIREALEAQYEKASQSAQDFPIGYRLGLEFALGVLSPESSHD